MLIVCGSERWTRCPINHEKANWTALAGTVPRPLSHPAPSNGRRVSSTWQPGPPPLPARADRRSGQRASQLNGRLLAFGLNLIKLAAAAAGGGEGAALTQLLEALHWLDGQWRQRCQSRGVQNSGQQNATPQQLANAASWTDCRGEGLLGLKGVCVMH